MFILERFIRKKKSSVMGVKVKKLHPKAVIPTYAKNGDAGLDLTAVSSYVDKFGNITYGTGLAFEIPEGYVGLLFPRSSVSKQNLSLCNSVGVLDSGYRGEVMFKFKPTMGEFNKLSVKHHYSIFSDNTEIYNVGERIGQLVIMPYPQVQLIEAQELSKTERSDGGFGSSGK